MPSVYKQRVAYSWGKRFAAKEQFEPPPKTNQPLKSANPCELEVVSESRGFFKAENSPPHAISSRETTQQLFSSPSSMMYEVA